MPDIKLPDADPAPDDAAAPAETEPAPEPVLDPVPDAGLHGNADY